MGQKQQTPWWPVYGSSGATNPSASCALGALPRVTETDHGPQAGSRPHVRNSSYGTEVEPKTHTFTSLQARRRARPVRLSG